MPPLEPSDSILQEIQQAVLQENERLRQENERLTIECDRLQQSESRYRQLFENAPVSIIFVAADGYVTQMNRASEQMYSWTLEQLTQQGFNIFTDPQLVKNGTLPYMQRALAGETAIEPPGSEYDASQTIAGANSIWYGRGHYFPIRNKAGEVQEFVELCSDYRLLHEAQQTLLEERDRAATERAKLLTTVAQVANLLLRSPDRTTVLPDVVRLLGEAVGSDRCCLTQDVADPETGVPAVRILMEWCQAGVSPSIGSTPDLETGVPWENFAQFRENHLQGVVSNYLIADLQEPTRSIFLEQSLTSILVVPILVKGQSWGQIGFDNCGEPRLYDEAEIAILQVAADSIAAAIERQEKDEELLRVEQERSQELERHNAELQQTLNRLAESEERYRTLFEISSEGIYRVEFDQPIPMNLPIDEQIQLIYQQFNLIEANSTYAAMYGKDDPEDLIGLRLTDVHVTQSRQNYAMMRALVENNHQIRNAETEEVDLEGNPRYFLNNITAIIKDGYAIGSWASQLDITELRLAQQALLKAEQERVAELAKTNAALKNSLDRLAAEPDLNAFLGHVLLEIARQLQIDRGSLHLYDARSQTLQFCIYLEQGQVHQPHQLHAVAPIAQSFSVEDLPLWEILLQTRKPFVITRDNPQYVFPGSLELQVEQQGIQAGINVLLTLGDEPIGLLGFCSTQCPNFTPEEQELAQALAHQATLAIQLTRLADEAKQAAIYEERNRLAGEIHDTLAQAFTGISIQLGVAKDLVATDPLETQRILDRALTLAQVGLTEARRSVWAIYPPAAEYANLDRTLAQTVDRLTQGNNTHVRFHLQGDPYPLPTLLGMNLLRIGQEALTNALKHSRATTIEIVLLYERDTVYLQVRDDGCGFVLSNEQGGFGLVSLYQRSARIGGELQVISQPGQGTVVKVQVSLERFATALQAF